MATQTRPFLMTGAALASAAAIVAATPAIMPSMTAPSPLALSAAQVELTTFSDLLSITPADWNDYLFVGWGGAIGPINIDPLNVANDYWLPLCNYDCTINGPSGLAYLALDALINGNGYGINAVNGILEDPSKPYQPDPTKPDYNPYAVEPWGTSAVNYFFEGGPAGSPTAGFQYLIESPFLGEPYKEPGPLYNPQISALITELFRGTFIVTDLYTAALQTIAVLASGIPVVGEYLYRGIGSYLGPAFGNIDQFYDYSFYAGISGVLRYVGGVITTAGNPNPYPKPQPEPSAAVTADTAEQAVSAAAGANDAAGGNAVAAASDAGGGSGAESTGTEAVEAATAASAVAESSPAETVPGAEMSDAETDAAEAAATGATAAETAAVEAASSTDTAAAADDKGTEAMLSSLPDSVTEAPAAAEAEAPAKSPKRPVRGALERATKRIASAIGGSRSGATAGGSASADAGSAGADGDS